MKIYFLAANYINNRTFLNAEMYFPKANNFYKIFYVKFE